MQKNKLKKSKFTISRIVILLSIPLLTLLFLGGYAYYNNYIEKHPKLANEEDILEMKQFVTNLKNAIGNEKGDWRDESKCQTIQSALIGAKEEYHCRIQYVREVSIDGGDARDVMELDGTKLKAHTGSEVVTTYSNEEDSSLIGSIAFSHKKKISFRQTCSMNYKNSDKTMKESLGCFIVADAVYKVKSFNNRQPGNE